MSTVDYSGLGGAAMIRRFKREAGIKGLGSGMGERTAARMCVRTEGQDGSKRMSSQDDEEGIGDVGTVCDVGFGFPLTVVESDLG